MSGILLDKPVNAMVETILLSWEAVVFLKKYEHEHGHCTDKPFNEKFLARVKMEFDRNTVDGFKQYLDGSFGYWIGDGYTRWHRISVKEIASLLDEAGLKYKPGKPTEVICL